MPEMVVHFESHGKYVGTDRPELIGKTAIVNVACGLDTVKIQADDRNTGYGFGWHEMPAADWELNTERGIALEATITHVPLHPRELGSVLLAGTTDRRRP